jgi:hypothetical protein
LFKLSLAFFNSSLSFVSKIFVSALGAAPRLG